MRPSPILAASFALAMLAPGAGACYDGFLSWDVGLALPREQTVGPPGPETFPRFFTLRVEGPCQGAVRVVLGGGHLADAFDAQLATLGRCGPEGFCGGRGMAWQHGAFTLAAPDRGFELTGALHHSRNLGHNAAYSAVGTYLDYDVALLHVLVSE